MITLEEAKRKAGFVFLEKYGDVFIRENIKRLSLSWTYGSKTIDVFFGIFSRDIDSADISDGKGGFIIKEEEFPKNLLVVRVDRRNGNTEIITE